MVKFEKNNIPESEGPIDRLLREIESSPKSQVSQLLDEINTFEDQRELFTTKWIKEHTDKVDSQKAVGILKKHAYLYYKMQSEMQAEVSVDKEVIISQYDKLLHYIDFAKYFFEQELYVLEEDFFEQLESLKKSVEFGLNKVKDYSGDINIKAADNMYGYLMKKWERLFKHFTHTYQNNLFNYEDSEIDILVLPQLLEEDIKKEILEQNKK